VPENQGHLMLGAPVAVAVVHRRTHSGAAHESRRRRKAGVQQPVIDGGNAEHHRRFEALMGGMPWARSVLCRD
jgi:hypothetical protein